MNQNDFQITNQMLEKWAELLKNEDVKVKCPPQELVIAYANNELEGELEKVIDEHIDYCTSCLELVLSIRAANAEVKNVEPAKLPDNFLQKIKANFKVDSNFSEVKIVKFKHDVSIDEKEVEEWCKAQADYNFAFVAQDVEQGRKILLKVIKSINDKEKKSFLYELELIDEVYNAGECYVTARMPKDCFVENLIACYGAWEGEKGEDILCRAYECNYNLKNGLINFNFRYDDMYVEKISQIVCFCE